MLLGSLNPTLQKIALQPEWPSHFPLPIHDWHHLCLHVTEKIHPVMRTNHEVWKNHLVWEVMQQRESIWIQLWKDLQIQQECKHCRALKEVNCPSHLHGSNTSDSKLRNLRFSLDSPHTAQCQKTLIVFQEVQEWGQFFNQCPIPHRHRFGGESLYCWSYLAVHSYVSCAVFHCLPQFSKNGWHWIHMA